VEQIYVSPLNVGGGLVPTRDGILPVPGPAALELLRRKGAPVYASEYGPEFLTPTGALVLATLANGFGPFPPMRLEQVGYGAGQKDFTIPNVLRVSIGALRQGWASRRQDRLAAEHAPDHGLEQLDAEADEVVQLETNIDDMNPEWYGHLSERLLHQGALDVSMSPVLMKKSRPGTLVSVLVPPDLVEAALAILFEETTTLGVRVQPLVRWKLARRVERVQTPFGDIRVKLALLNGAVRSVAPEYEDCRAAALRAGVALGHVYAAAQSAAGELGVGARDTGDEQRSTEPSSVTRPSSWAKPSAGVAGPAG
jgi:hypothetical protein